MNWTAEQIQTALGMTGVVLQGATIIAGQGLALEVANVRFQQCLAAGKLMPDAKKYQVLDWLDDHGISKADVDSAIEQMPDEAQRRKALIRWHSINRVPADNSFVAFVANQLNIDHTTAWWEILAK